MTSEIQTYIHVESFGHLATGDEIIDASLKQRDEAIALVDGILERMDKLNNLKYRDQPSMGHQYASLVDDVVRTIRSYSTDFSGTYRKDIVKKIDARYWHTAMASSKLTVAMNTSAKEKMEDAISSSPPIFEAATVYSTLNHYLTNRMAIFVEGVIELFQDLSHEYKSNDKICFRKRIVFRSALSGKYWNHYSSAKNRVCDLERVFVLLDGKDPTEYESGELSHQLISEAYSQGLNEIDLPYFRCKMYLNGNVHIWLTRTDLVDKLNNLIANHFGASLGARASKK